MEASSFHQQGDTQMTMTHDEQNGYQLPGRSLLLALTLMPTAAFRSFRQWYLDTIQKRATAKLPTHLKYDIGEIDLMPTAIPTFIQSEPSSYQDQLQQMWLR
jgi:hypothetical protein